MISKCELCAWRTSTEDGTTNCAVVGQIPERTLKGYRNDLALDCLEIFHHNKQAKRMKNKRAILNQTSAAKFVPAVCNINLDEL